MEIRTIVSHDFLSGASIINWLHTLDGNGNLIFFYRKFQDFTTGKCRPAAVRSARDSSARPFTIGAPHLEATCSSLLESFTIKYAQKKCIRSEIHTLIDTPTFSRKSFCSAILLQDLQEMFFIGSYNETGLVRIRLWSAENVTIRVVPLETSFPAVAPSFAYDHPLLIFKTRTIGGINIHSLNASSSSNLVSTLEPTIRGLDVVGPISLSSYGFFWVLVNASMSSIRTQLRKIGFKRLYTS